METVSFEDFAKLDLRVAKIMEVESVEGSDKLYKLTIRIGEETRTLAAGLAQHYAPDELLGKKIIVVANLQPKTLKGIQSQGMLLAAEDSKGEVVLLAPEREIEDGSKIH